MRVAALLLMAMAVAGCREATAPAAPPAPPLPPFSVRFADGSVQVAEGEVASIRMLYEVRSLGSAATLRLVVSPDAASEDDYALSEETVTIPGGNAGRGEVKVSLEALADALITEGDEALSLSLSSTGGAGTLPSPLEVVIKDARYPACPGIGVAGSPVTPFGEGDAFRGTLLTLDMEPNVGVPRLELLGNYRRTKITEPVPLFGVRSWQIEAGPASVTHRMDINWPGDQSDWFDEGSLQLQLSGGSCAAPAVIACGLTHCEVRPSSP